MDPSVALEDAWGAVHEALPARWQVGPALYSPERRGWLVAALRDLDDRLRGVPQPDGSRMAELNRRLRFAYLDGAEAQSRQDHGRGLAADELERVLRQYPGDVEADG